MTQPILPIRHEWALFDTAGTRQIEQRAAAALPAHTLMRRAGEAVARLALAIAPHAQRVWVAAGPGNNGGDGLEAAIHLLGWGKAVEITLHGDPAALPADARTALARAQAAGVRIGSASVVPNDPPQLAIDALLGVGASRAPQGAIAACIRQLNALACPVVAVDLPSGLHAGTGQPLGDACVIATHTLALLTLKPGLFTGAGRDHTGRVWLDTLGVDASGELPQARLSAVTPNTPLGTRRHAQHKGSFGDVAVVGGARGMSGAALLAARAAHAAGAGRVYVELLDPASGAAFDPTRPELMFRPGWSHSARDVLARATVVCGCGGDDAVRAPLPRLLSGAARLVLDADALNVIAGDTSLATLLRARAPRGLATVLTPHPLEAARLLACSTSEVQADRLRSARELADRFDCVVVLKGSGSVIAANGQVPRINSTGNAALATAGTGDVLAGWLAGRWAQSPIGHEAAAAFEVACRAVAEHGAAAEPQPSGPLRAADLIERLYR
ncbi:MAG: NAD(P)H-hydrate dehydratase [Burkholderiales bacterium]|nr:NAD(P)H-hydrate dehydratase [Burkholderiales bacterium]